MNIHGFTKTTLLDFPGHVACTVFTAGCNFRCPFCHNGDLVLQPEIYPVIEESVIISHIKKRRNILTGICISGGEPTLQPDLPDFMKKIKETGLLVKLDTNGYRPDILKNLIDKGLVDYIAMDIKSSCENYSSVTDITIDISRILESVNIISSSNIDYEFRTACVKGLHTDNDFISIAKWLPSDCTYFLQSYKENEAVINKSCSSFSKNELENFKEIIQPFIPSVSLRGVD